MFLTNQDFLRPNKGGGGSWVGVGGQGHPQTPFPKPRLPAIGGTKYKILLHSVYGGYSRKWVLSDYAIQPLSHYGSMLITFFFIIKVGPSLLATPSLVSRKKQSITIITQWCLDPISERKKKQSLSFNLFLVFPAVNPNLLLLHQRAALTRPQIHGDERDGIIAKLNQLQAYWGTGKGFFSQQEAVDFTPENQFCRFKVFCWWL